jgi:hypothetical protein
MKLRIALALALTLMATPILVHAAQDGTTAEPVAETTPAQSEPLIGAPIDAIPQSSCNDPAAEASCDTGEECRSTCQFLGYTTGICVRWIHCCYCS